jgi:IS605 OrfB family transposase
VWLNRRAHQQAHDATYACGLRWNELNAWLRAEWDAGRRSGKRDLRSHGDRLGLPGVYSQTRQAIADDLWEAVKSSRSNKRNGRSEMRAPWREKKYRHLAFSTQAWRVRSEKLILPFGKGHPDITIPAPRVFDSVTGEIVQPDRWREISLGWDRQERSWFLSIPYLTLRIPIPQADKDDTDAVVVAVDEGVINSMTLATITLEGDVSALVVNGREIRSIKQGHNKRIATISSLKSRCKPGSKRHKRLARVERRQKAKTARRLRNADHHVAKKVSDWIRDEAIDKTTGEIRPVRLVIGDVAGIEQKTRQQRRASRSQRQQLSQWSRGRQERYLSEKTGLALEYVNEAHTSQTCPACGARKKPSGRVYACRNSVCGLVLHRDVVGAVNIHHRGRSGEDELSSYIRSGTKVVVKYQRALPYRRVVVASNRATTSCGVAEKDATRVMDSPRRRPALACNSKPTTQGRVTTSRKPRP